MENNDDNEDDDNNEKPKKPVDPLAKAFGLEPVSIRPNGKLIVPNMNDDYEHVRQNLVDLEEKGRQYLHQFGQVAMSAQEPRHIEVLTNLLNSLVAINKSILEVKILDQEIKAKGEMAGEGNKTINNNLFVGSPDELQDMLEKMKKKD